MREAPGFVSAGDVLAVVRSHWAVEVDAVEHLPVGFGAYHWRGSYGGVARVFVTLDGLEPRHSVESLEGAYAGAAQLAASGLEFVVASLPTRDGVFTASLADGRISCAPWLEGKATGEGPIGSEDLARQNVAALSRLHAATPPSGIPKWRPLVGEDFADSLSELLRDTWRTGPYGERAHRAVGERLEAIRRWTASYHALGRQARERPWVPTHGEPHTVNQVRTDDEVVFVDWESLALAPRERDLRSLVDAGYADLVAPDRDMLRLFDLEWRLDEISQYATWFSQPHTGTANDQVAFTGLLEELARPD
ncbi:hypothetical protein [Kribbella deserti]|uniref:Aminoglycoside phosphotransferase n=1 Tax=Kribbella deserti TaxID=1926257 RepID=A0ABV6QDQ1_9ACTN